MARPAKVTSRVFYLVTTWRETGMAQLNADGYFDIRFNQDKTQAFVDIFPPQGGGRNATTLDITTALEKKKIAYGIRHDAICEAVAKVASTAAPVNGVLAAQ